MNEKLGIVLSGGGIRGVAHIGLLKALRQNGIEPQVISGASAGALVGALYAKGYSEEEMLDFFRNTPLFAFSYYSARKPGLLDSDCYRAFFETYFPEDRFEALHKQLYVATTDIVNAQPLYFSSGELISPLLASAALPPVFTPVEIEGQLYADGGIMNNLPVEPLLSNCDHIIGSFVNPVKKVKKAHFTNSMRVFQRAYDLRFYANNKAKFERCNFVFEPGSLYKIGLFDTRQIDEVFKIGYQTALAQMELIFNALEENADTTTPTSDRWEEEFSLN